MPRESRGDAGYNKTSLLSGPRRDHRRQATGKKKHHTTCNRYYVRVASGNLAFHIAVQGGCRGESMIAGRSTITVVDNRYFYT